MKRLSCIVIFMLAAMVLSVRADGGADDQYIMVYGLIQEADALSSDQPAQALAKYRDAYAALQAFRKIYPDWNDRIVVFRLNYLEEKMAAIAPPTSAVSAVTNTPPPRASAPAQTQPVNTAETDRRIEALNDQLKQLEAEKDALESKLKEAFATQPAAADPRELVKAREKIESLMKENDLLKVSLTNQSSGTPAVTDSKAVDEVKRALAETSRKLDEQTDRANNLALEKQVLQSRLDALASQKNDATALEDTRKALDDANQKLASQAASAGKLAKERDALQSRVEALAAGAAAADTLRAENEGLKKQLADARSAVEKAQEQEQKLANSESRVASLQSENGVLQLEKTALENRLKQPSARPEDLARINQLEGERDDLKQKLESASKEAASRPARKSKSTEKVEELSRQVTTLRARLDVLEAHPVPYTPEELALFRKSSIELDASNPKGDTAAKADTTTKGDMVSVRELPPGTAMLAAEAQRDFEASRFDKAHEKYQEILRQDDKNIYTLANLAAIELEMNDLVAAEKHITQAVAIAPDDGYNLSILGYLRFRQERFDEALDALSRAAKANPQSAEIQNYLGVTLSHKGLRIPAETALRKAIEIDPSYGNAHNNLAVIYATQQPPLLELARWHYQKALATGQPRNPELEKLLQLKSE